MTSKLGQDNTCQIVYQSLHFHFLLSPANYVANPNFNYIFIYKHCIVQFFMLLNFDEHLGYFNFCGIFFYYKQCCNKFVEDIFLDTCVSLGNTAMRVIAWHRVCTYLQSEVLVIPTFILILVLRLNVLNAHYLSFCYVFSSSLSVG